MGKKYFIKSFVFLLYIFLFFFKCITYATTRTYDTKKRKNDLNSLLMKVTKTIFIFIQT